MSLIVNLSVTNVSFTWTFLNCLLCGAPHGQDIFNAAIWLNSVPNSVSNEINRRIGENPSNCEFEAASSAGVL